MATNFNTALDFGHRYGQRTFQEMVGSVPNKWINLFNPRSTARNVEAEVGLGDAGNLPARTTTAIADMNMQDLFTSLYTMTEFAAKDSKRINDWTTMDSDLQGNMRAGLAQAVASTIETQAWAVFNFAFDPTHAGGDGLELCSTVHPRKPGAGVYVVNKDTGALTALTYEAYRRTMLTQLSPEGVVSRLPDPKFLIVPTSLRSTALQVTKSLTLSTLVSGDGTIGTINPIVSDGIQVIEVPDLDIVDTDNWFLAREPSMSGLQMFMRAAPMFNEGDNQETLTHYMNATVTFGTGWNSPRQIFGAEV